MRLSKSQKRQLGETIITFLESCARISPTYILHPGAIRVCQMDAERVFGIPHYTMSRWASRLFVTVQKQSTHIQVIDLRATIARVRKQLCVDSGWNPDEGVVTDSAKTLAAADETRTKKSLKRLGYTPNPPQSSRLEPREVYCTSPIHSHVSNIDNISPMYRACAITRQNRPDVPLTPDDYIRSVL